MSDEWTKGEYTISCDPARLDLEVVYAFLSGESYWAQGRSRERVERSVANSLPFGLYRDGAQVGFARVVTDYATFAWLADVFVLDSVRGRGLGLWLVETILAHPQLRGVRRWLLATRDAQELYRRFGFRDLAGSPLGWMEKLDAQIV
ncbi:MAG: GNAT family N-acetyltransferase [Acidobacteria bacterium]|nr:GNAT family N-acetyltransferase [Acidobacteriota bacterium]MCA1640439.1 GNAT family N-acetyltransferase [Acidobacteriota bacterium]